MLLLALGSSPAARAADEIVEPERITAGSADQFLAVLDPAAARMFYVSNENATTELFGVDLNVRAPKRLFDESADVTWPRVSPDGNKLLYLSFRSAATGELCVRDLVAKSLDVSDRRCISLGGRTAMHALWEPSGKSALVVSRDGLGGAIDLRRFAIDALGGGEQAGEVLLKRDLSSPALSHDGRWLLYVPVIRQTGLAAPAQPDATNPIPAVPSAGLPSAAEETGAIAAGSIPSAVKASGRPGPAIVAASARTSRTLALLDLKAPSASPHEVKFELPGFPGFPTFSADDKFVYFVQYLNDTNHDGAVDANDRGVLFRAPFDSAAASPIDGARAQQLTSAEWNCQYPFAGKDRLIATCLTTGSLDIFSLPLEGAVPAGWTRERIADELKADRPPWEELLLYTRALELATTPRDRAFELKRIIETHLKMREYQSAGFYAGQLEKQAATIDGAGAGASAKEDEGLAQVLHELARHRRSLASIGEGQSTTAFIEGARARLAKLQPLRDSKIASVARLAALVQSEISDSLGDKGRALALLEEVTRSLAPRAPADPLVLHLLAVRARELYDSLAQRDDLLAAELLLCEHPSLDEAEQLGYAEDYLHDLLRGRAEAEQDALLDRESKKLGPESNAAFAIALERALRGLTSKNQSALEVKLFALFDATKAYERRRTLVHEAIDRAQSTDSETLWYDLAEKWAQSVDKQRPDRKRTEQLYSQVGLERAYAEWSEGKLDEARAHFDAVTRHTSSLEAYADDIDVSLQSGATPKQLAADFEERFKDRPDAPEVQFALAHIEGRGLPAEPDAQAVAARGEEGKNRLRTALHTMPNDMAIHYLWAYLRHQEYLRTGDKDTAMRANSHYLIVLDLARENPRYRAATLSGLGFLHGRLGNHSMAAGFLEEREKLPFANPISELAVCLSHARSLLHSDHETESAALSDRCVALTDKSPSLARFVIYALDHSALYHLDAGEPDKALVQYDRLDDELKKLPLAPGDLAGRRNRFVVSLGRASARLSSKLPREALADLDAAEALFNEPGGISLLQSTYPRKSSSGAFTKEGMTEDDEVLLTGLRARALTALGDIKGAEAQTLRRQKLLGARMARDGEAEAADDDRKVYGLVEANLASDRYAQGDIPGAIAAVESGLRAADLLAEHTATPVHAIGLTLLREYADLHFIGKVPLEQLKLDLPGRIARMFGEMTDHPQPRWLELRERFRLDLEQLMLDGVPVTFPGPKPKAAP